MKTLAKWVIQFSCGFASLLGAAVVGWGAVQLFLMFSGTLAPGQENRLLGVVPSYYSVARSLIVGVVLLVGGYKIPKYFIAKYFPIDGNGQTKC